MNKNGFTLIEAMILFLIFLILITLSVFTYFTICPDYSSGERTGVVVKMSRKGIFWKTWEGEMNIGSMSTYGNGMAVPMVFEFSVKNEEVVEKLKEVSSSGKRTTVLYSQALSRSIRDGETTYLIEGVK